MLDREYDLRVVKENRVSRVGKVPVPVPSGVEVKISGSQVDVKGPKGSLSRVFDPEIVIEQDADNLVVTRSSDQPRHRALHGLTRALLHNMVQGVSEGFTKQLEIVGVGYRAEKRPRGVLFNLGFSHPILFVPPPGIEVQISKPTALEVVGIDKELVGEVAAKIRSFKPPEPYKGKGIRYVGEYVRRKAGKTVK